MMYAWRAILWSLAACASASRRFAPVPDCIQRADSILKAFDERFKVVGNFVTEDKPLPEPQPLVTYKEGEDGSKTS